MLAELNTKFYRSLITDEDRLSADAAFMSDDLDKSGVLGLVGAVLSKPETGFVPMSVSAPQWARHELKYGNPWDLIKNNITELFSAPAGDEGLCLILKDIAEMSDPEISDEVCGIANFVIGDCIKRILSTHGKSRSNKKLVKGERFTDIARFYLEPLRFIKEYMYHSADIDFCLEELILEPTVKPVYDWIDPYTGEIDQDILDDYELNIREPDDYDLLACEIENNEPRKLMLGDHEVILLEDEPHYGEAFNADFDGEEVFFDEVDVNEPMWMAIQNDEDAQDYEELKEAVDWTIIKTAYNFLRDAILTEIASFVDDGNYTKEDYPFFSYYMGGIKLPIKIPAVTYDYIAERVQTAFRTSHQAEDMIRHFRDMTILYTYSSIGKLLSRYVNEWMFELIDMAEVSGSVHDFIMDMDEPEEFDPREWVGDQEYIEAFSEESLQLELSNCQPASSGCQPQKSKEYVEAFLRHALNAQSIGSSNDNPAVSSAWDAWREAVCPEGNKAFKEARREGKTNSEAMKVFHAHKNKIGIAGVKESGLRLTTGRFVNWRVAAMKIKEKELILSSDESSRLKQLLVDKGWGDRLFLELL